MSPFDLRGPAFLLFYLICGGALLAFLALARRRAEGGPMPKVALSDPYQIAYLREGPWEAVRICLVSLADRGLLQDEDGLLKASPGAPGIARRALERRVLERFASPGRPESVLDDLSVKAEADQIGAELTRTGLLPDEETTRARHGRTVLVMGLLVALAVTKVIVALSRGRTNVLFLIILGLVMTGVAWTVGHPRRTLRGDHLIADLRTLFAGLRGRASSLRPGGASAEAGPRGRGFRPGRPLPDRLPCGPPPDTGAGRGLFLVGVLLRVVVVVVRVLLRRRRRRVWRLWELRLR